MQEATSYIPARRFKKDTGPVCYMSGIRPETFDNSVCDTQMLPGM